MKLKHVIASLSLGLVTAFGVATGVSLKKEAKEVKAEGNDRMFSVVIDLADAVGYTDFHKPEAHYWDAATSTVDAYVDLHQLNGTYYTVNIPYSSEYAIDHIQFLFKQTNDVDKWSNDIEFVPTESYVYHFAFQNTWTGDNWNVEMDTWKGTPRVRGEGISDQNFTADVSSGTYKVADLELEPGNTYQVFFGKWGFGAFRQSSIDSYLDDFSMNSFQVQFAGTYDIICYNEYADGGVFEIKLHSETTEYIYLVGYDITEETALYTYGEGGVEEFGAFPGERLKNIASAEEVHGDLRFQGEEYNIWRVRLDMYYPKADHLILSQLNEFGVVGAQTANMLLIRDSAYWFSYENDYHNDLGGQSIKWLLQVEEIRKAAENQSVCNISKEQATAIVNEYKSQGDFIHTTYIDSTDVLTHKRDGSEGTELVSYRYVMEELAKIAEINLANPSTSLHSIANNNGALIIVIVSSISVIAIASLFIIRRRRAMR